MGFTASYGSCSFYCTVNGTYTITKQSKPQRAQKQKNLNSYIITYTYYWYSDKTLLGGAMWQKTQELICAKIPHNIYSVIYAKVKQDISANYTIVDDI